MNELTYLDRKEIDIQKWDDCIRCSPNGTVYALSWYIDNMADNWSALVMNDYEAVMPLPRRKKYGIHYLYQPALLQRLGIFGKYPLPAGTIALFYYSVPRWLQYWDYNIDQYSVPENNIGYFLKKRTNYTLDLSLPYHDIYTQYSRLARRMLYKSINCSIADVPIADAIRFYRSNYGHRLPLKEDDYKKFQSVCRAGFPSNATLSFGVVTSQSELTAITIMFDDGKSIFNVFGGLNTEGKQNGALYFLLDHVFKKYAGSGRTFDFEGSDIPNVAAFFEKFGAQKGHYYHLRYNHLPWPLNKLKR